MTRSPTTTITPGLDAYRLRSAPEPVRVAAEGRRSRAGPARARPPTAICAASAALRRMIRTLTARLCPSVERVEVRQQERRHRLAGDVVAAQQRQPVGQGRSCSAGSSCSSTGSGLASTSAPACTPWAARAVITSATCGGGVQLPVQVEAAVGDEEAGEPAGPVAGDGDAEGLQPFQGRADVEDRLHAGADHHDRRTGQRRSGRPTRRRWPRVAVHAAETAGGEDADLGGGGDRAGGGDRGGAVRALGGGERQVADGEFGHAVRPARWLSWASSRPTISSPPIMPMVAGTAPLSRTVCSISRATRRLSGRGRPCETIVLSSATTGRRPGAPGSHVRRTGSRSGPSAVLSPSRSLPYGALRRGLSLDRPAVRCQTCRLELLPPWPGGTRSWD